MNFAVIHQRALNIVINTNKKAYIVNMNNYRYNAVKPMLSKEIKLKNLLSHLTHKELKNIIMNKIIY